MKPFVNLVIISLLILSCSKKEENSNSIMPEGAIWKTQTIKFENAPPNFSAMLIWAQAATLKSDQAKTIKAIVTIDFWKVLENSTNVIYEEHYDYSTQKFFSTGEAGLYCRFPKWFDSSCNDQHFTAYNMSAINSLLTIDVSQTPDKIIHWWTPRQIAKQNTSYSVEVKIKVEGSTAVQFGLDYWRDFIVSGNGWDANCITSNNCEAWISNWIGDTKGQFITITLPSR